MSDTLKAIDRQQGFDDLAAVVAEEAESVRDFDSIFLLRGEDGSFRAGNVQNVRLFTGWGELDRAWLPMVADKGNPDDRFFAMWTPVSKGQLLVGGSDREIREVRRILLHGLGWALRRHAAACRRLGDVSWRGARSRRSTCSRRRCRRSAAARFPSACP